MVNSSRGMCDGPRSRPGLTSGRVLLVLVLLTISATAAPGQAALDGHEPAMVVDVAPAEPRPGSGYLTGAGHGPGMPDGHSGHVRLAHAPPPHQLDLDSGHARMEFVCPDPSRTPSFDDLRNADYSITAQCPYRVYDTLFTFGSPAIAVDPKDARRVSMVALHGEATTEGATERSRSGQTHTTFLSTTQGIYWTDTPTEGGFQSTVEFGEYATAVYDDNGLLHIGFLHSRVIGGEYHGSRIALMKTEGADGSLPVRTYYKMAAYFPNTTPAGRVDSLHLTTVQQQGNDTLEPQDGARTDGQNRSGNQADGSPFRDHDGPERVVALWREQVADDVNHTFAGSGFVDATWGRSGTATRWTNLPEEQRVGPCDNVSRPVGWDGRVYFACVAGAGYDHRPLAAPGDVDLWSLDTATGETRYESRIPIDAGSLHLTTNEEGYMLAVSHSVDDVGDFHAQAAFGFHGTQWSATGDMGDFLRSLAGAGEPLIDADITAIALGGSSDAVLVFKEWVHETTEPRVPSPSDVDPDRPPKLGDYRKVVFTLNECDGITAAAQLNLGAGLEPYHYQSYQANPGAVNDIQDGLQFVPDPGGRELAYFAVNDYGAIQYGAIDVLSSSTFCQPLPVLPAVGGLAAPQALSTATAAGTLYSAALGIPAALMVGYLLTVKRRQANLVVAGDE